ncbi:MAG: hypothetical protein EA369_04510 [Bradymonadales bacterium]|nr:MAG: hypothetical protein EA369_04510 [Bradymonadales bacterium]
MRASIFPQLFVFTMIFGLGGAYLFDRPVLAEPEGSIQAGETWMGLRAPGPNPVYSGSEWDRPEGLQDLFFRSLQFQESLDGERDGKNAELMVRRGARFQGKEVGLSDWDQRHWHPRKPRELLNPLGEQLEELSDFFLLVELNWNRIALAGKAEEATELDLWSVEKIEREALLSRAAELGQLSALVGLDSEEGMEQRTELLTFSLSWQKHLELLEGFIGLHAHGRAVLNRHLENERASFRVVEELLKDTGHAVSRGLREAESRFRGETRGPSQNTSDLWKGRTLESKLQKVIRDVGVEIGNLLQQLWSHGQFDPPKASKEHFISELIAASRSRLKLSSASLDRAEIDSFLRLIDHELAAARLLAWALENRVGTQLESLVTRSIVELNQELKSKQNLTKSFQGEALVLAVLDWSLEEIESLASEARKILAGEREPVGAENFDFRFLRGPLAKTDSGLLPKKRISVGPKNWVIAFEPRYDASTRHYSVRVQPLSRYEEAAIKGFGSGFARIREEVLLDPSIIRFPTREELEREYR